MRALMMTNIVVNINIEEHLKCQPVLSPTMQYMLTRNAAIVIFAFAKESVDRIPVPFDIRLRYVQSLHRNIRIANANSLIVRFEIILAYKKYRGTRGR